MEKHWTLLPVCDKSVCDFHSDFGAENQNDVEINMTKLGKKPYLDMQSDLFNLLVLSKLQTSAV
jgi:hypothetical protein